MSKSDFDAFVKRQQIEQQEEEAAFDSKQQLSEWLGHLDTHWPIQSSSFAVPGLDAVQGRAS